MPTRSQLLARQGEILQKIAELGPIRKGSITASCVRKKDGTVCGPYPLYTCKKKGKTVGRRLSAKEAALYQVQIERFRAYEKLTEELLALHEQLADVETAPEEMAQKKTPRR